MRTHANEASSPISKAAWSPLPVDNIDTDQIIPARFLKTTSKEGLDKQLFYDWRYDAQGNPKPDFILNQPAGAGRAGPAGGRQFRLRQLARACSVGADAVRIPRRDQHVLRRHLQAELAEELAAADRGCQRDSRGAIPAVEADPQYTVTVDLAAQKLVLPDGRAVEFPVDAFSKHCLLEGVDELGYIQQHEAEIAAYEAAGRTR